MLGTIKNKIKQRSLFGDTTLRQFSPLPSPHFLLVWAWRSARVESLGSSQAFSEHASSPVHRFGWIIDSLECVGAFESSFSYVFPSPVSASPGLLVCLLLALTVSLVQVTASNIFPFLYIYEKCILIYCHNIFLKYLLLTNVTQKLPQSWELQYRQNCGEYTNHLFHWGPQFFLLPKETKVFPLPLSTILDIHGCKWLHAFNHFSYYPYNLKDFLLSSFSFHKYLFDIYYIPATVGGTQHQKTRRAYIVLIVFYLSSFWRLLHVP